VPHNVGAGDPVGFGADVEGAGLEPVTLARWIPAESERTGRREACRLLISSRLTICVAGPQPIASLPDGGLYDKRSAVSNKN